MDPTDHGHVPYVYILVRAMHDWKAAVCVQLYLAFTGRAEGDGVRPSSSRLRTCFELEPAFTLLSKVLAPIPYCGPLTPRRTNPCSRFAA
jgi:hypothetical protein